MAAGPTGRKQVVSGVKSVVIGATWRHV